MSDAKKKLLQEINNNIKKQKAIRQEKANGLIYAEKCAREFIEEVEDINSIEPERGTWEQLIKAYKQNFEYKMSIIDPGCRVSVSWFDSSNDQNKLPQISGVTIKWSNAYIATNNCDPELFIDLTCLLLKD